MNTDTNTIAAASLDALLAVHGGQQAERALNEVGRRFRLPSDDRLAVKQWLYRTLRWQGRFDAVLKTVKGPWNDPVCGSAARLALSSNFDHAGDPRLLKGLAVELTARGKGRAAKMLDGLAPVARQYTLPTDTDELAYLAETYSHPLWLVEKLAADFPDDFVALLESNNSEPPTTIRANPVKTTREELSLALFEEGVSTRPTTHSSLGLHVTSQTDIFRTAAFKEGLFEVQDEGVQLLAFLLGTTPEGLVLDTQAGSGGIALLLASVLGKDARLLAIDTHSDKLSRLEERAQRAGVGNLDTMVVEAGGVPEELVEAADDVIVHAPSSNLGVLRRYPDIKWRLQAEDIDELAARQLGILGVWAQAVKPGGLLFYATSTITPEENEQVVDRFLQTHPEFELEPDSGDLPAEHERFLTPTGSFQCLPHRHGTDGCFAARMRRK
jgi:16S rRNA (cytosine967-C5)-methyltransferase